MRWLPICAYLLLASRVSPALSHAQSGADAAAAKAISSQTAPTTRHAAQLIDRGEIGAALAELDALAMEHPALPGVEYLKGFAYYQKSELANAEIAFKKALSQDPRDRESRQLLGITLYREGRPADAIPILEAEHSSLGVANVDPSYLLALCYIDVQRYDDARRSIAAECSYSLSEEVAYSDARYITFKK